MATDRHQAPSYPLRMPEELKTRVAEAASAAGRSLHAELLARIEEGLDQAQQVREMSNLVIRLERDLAFAEVYRRTLQLRMGSFAKEVRHLLTGGAKPRGAELKELLQEAEIAMREAVEASAASDSLKKMFDAANNRYEQLVIEALPSTGPNPEGK